MADPAADAYAEAIRRLARRPLTEQELRSRLAGCGYPPVQIDDALQRLQSEGAQDDRSLTAHFMTARMERLGHGPERLVRDLIRRGVDEDLARAVFREAVERGDLDPDRILDREVRRRIPGSTVTPADYRRVYNAMLRAGFEPMSIRRALDRRRRDPDACESEFPQE